MSTAQASTRFRFHGSRSLAVLLLGLLLAGGCSEQSATPEAADKQASLAREKVSKEDSVERDPLAAARDVDDSSAEGAVVKNPTAVENQLLEDLIQSVVDSLNHLDEFDPGQILPQLRERLNQWMWQSRRTDTWKLDPLVGSLDPNLASFPLIQQILKNLDKGIFTIAGPGSDMIGLQEAIWLRDIARSARGSQLDDVSVAEQLFDWTVRNLQLVEDPVPPALACQNSVAEILLTGRATARERAWIFLLLLRQQGLDGVMLATASSDGGPPREWLPALVTDNDLVLFDSWLGMPLPGPDGKHPATLAEVAAHDELLRKLDLDATRPYPVKAEQLAHLVAYVEASPMYLSRRMETLDARMTGEQRVVTATRPSQLAQRLTGRPGIDEVRVWPLAYEFLQARASLAPGQLPPAAMQLMAFQMVEPLSKGRILEFKGEFDGPRGAMANYLNARLMARRAKQKARTPLPPQQQQFLEAAKQDASYWLGLIAFEKKDYPVAIDYFARRTLELAPDGPWTDGARYNLARSYEAQGQFAPAIELYQADSSPQKHGNRLRGRRLKSETTDQQAADEKQP